MYRRLVVISMTWLAPAALGACAEPDSPPALDAGVVADAAADLPLRPVTVTVESHRRPVPNVRVFTSTSDGRYIADGVTDAAGSVTLIGGATATAFDTAASAAMTAPLGANDSIRLELDLISPAVPSTTWGIDIATPPAFDGPLQLYTPCGDGRLFVPSVDTASIEGPACDRADVVALRSSPEGRPPQFALATRTPGAPARFERWHDVRPIQIDVNVAPNPSAGPVSVETWASIAPDFGLQFARSLPVDVPGVVSVYAPGRGRYARRFETAPATMTVEASDFAPPLQPIELVGDAPHLRGIRIDTVGRTFDACSAHFTAETPELVYWTIVTDPITDAHRLVHVPTVPTGLAVDVTGVSVTCFENQSFADPARPERTVSSAASW